MCISYCHPSYLLLVGQERGENYSISSGCYPRNLERKGVRSTPIPITGICYLEFYTEMYSTEKYFITFPVIITCWTEKNVNPYICYDSLLVQMYGKERECLYLITISTTCTSVQKKDWNYVMYVLYTVTFHLDCWKEMG